MFKLKITFKKIISTVMLMTLALFLMSFSSNNLSSNVSVSTSSLNSLKPINVESNFVNPSMTSSGMTIVTDSPFSEGGGSYSLSGSSSFIRFAQSTDWNLGTGNFTVEWFQKQNDSNSWPRVFQMGNYPATFGVSLEGGAFYGWFSSGYTLGSTGNIKSIWTHFAMVRDGTTIRVYKNGVLIGSTTVSSSLNIGDSTTPFTVGNELNAQVIGAFGGLITNFRLVKGVSVYSGTNSSSANFTVPNKNLTSTSVANPFGGTNTAQIPAGATKLLLIPNPPTNFNIESFSAGIPSGFEARSNGTVSSSNFTVNNNRLSFTDNNSESSVLHYSNPISYTTGFMTYFEMDIVKNGDVLADGFTFLIGNQKSAGSSGGGLGYSGYPGTSNAVAFDNYQNAGDQARIATFIGTNGSVTYNSSSQYLAYDNETVTGLAARYTSAASGTTVKKYKIWITYDLPNKILKVVIGSPIQDNVYTKEFTNITLVNTNAYIGISAATGGSQTIHALAKWSFTSNYYSDSTAPSTPVLSPVQNGNNFDLNIASNDNLSNDLKYEYRSSTSSVWLDGTKVLPASTFAKNWSSTSNPLIAWILPNTRTRFAIPSNGSIAVFEYSNDNGNSWIKFPEGGYIADPIIHQGIVYSGYSYSTDWTTGNPSYIHRAIIDGVTYLSAGNEVVSRSNSLYTEGSSGGSITNIQIRTVDQSGNYSSIVNQKIYPQLTYNLNYNSLTSTESRFFSTNFTLSSPTRTGYTFGGWFTDNSTFNNQYTSTVYPSTDTTLYAKWVSNQVTLSFDTAGGTAVQNVVGEYNTNLPNINNPTKIGYTFNGWSPSLPTKFPATNTTYTANWTANVYTVTFNANGGNSPSVSSKSVTYNSTYGTLATISRPGHTFNGWFTETNGGTLIQSSTSVTTLQNQNLYAQWSANEYTINFNKNNGTGGSDSVPIIYSQPLPVATAPTRVGYTFGGYYSATNGAGDLYYNSSMVSQRNYMLESNITLYAKWTANITLAKPTLSSANSSTIFNFTDASTNYTLPVYSGNEIVLTNAGDQASAFFFNEKIILNNGFSTYFEIKQYKTSGELPADGLVFVLSANTNSIGASGDGLGYSGINNSLGVVFDNYQNGSEPNPVFTTVYLNGNTSALWKGNQSIQYDTSLPTAYNAAATGALVRTYKVWLNFEVLNSQTLSGNLYFKIDVSGTISTYTFTEVIVPKEFYAGFTAATGGSQVKFAIPTWYLSNSYYADGINPTSTTETFIEDRSAPSAPVLTLNKTSGTQSSLVINGSVDNLDGTNVIYQYSFDQITWIDYLGNETFDTSTNSRVYARAFDNAGNISINSNATTRYILTFNSNNGTTIDNLSEIPNASFTRPIDPTRVGYSFVNWYTDNTTFNNLFDFNNGITQDTTIYAKWQGLPFTITFDKQTGLDGDSSIGVIYGSPMTAAVAPTKFGYNFNGYFSQTNGQGTQYYNGSMQSVTDWNIDSNTTLYAYWTPKVVVVTLDKQTGTGGPATISATFDAAMPSSVQAPYKPGHDFVGYFSQTNGQGNKYYDASMASLLNWDLDTTSTLYAYYTPATFTITFYANNGNSPSFVSKDVTYNQTYGELPTIDRTGYDFVGWFDAASGGTQITTASNVAIIDDESFYAQWTPKTYTVTFDKQTGINGTNSVTASYDNALPVATAPTKSGYTFGGYYTETNGDGTQYYSNLMVSQLNYSLLEGITLYAKWTANQYTITFDPYTGTLVGDNTKQVTFDQTFGALPTATKVGHTFAGWYTSQVAGFIVQPEDINTNYTNLTLYARWTVNSYNINFITNGGNNISPLSVNFGANITAPVATKAGGYEFVAWYPTLPTTMPDTDLTVTAIYKRIIVENDFSVTNINSNFKDGLIRFSLGVADPSARIFVDNEVNLASPGSNVNSGVISRSGSNLYYGTGTSLVKFGEVDATLNGQNGNDLQVNVNSTVLFTNGNFSNDFSNWTVVNGNYSISGDSGTGMTYQSSVENVNGNKFARLYVYGQANPNGTAHGPYMTSSAFSAKPGDTISFKWRADANSDDYDVYAFLDNGGVKTQLLYSRGATQSNFVTREITLTDAMLPGGLTNNLKFIFVAGSYDRSGGRVIGATFYIDDVSIVDNGVTANVINNLIRNVKYMGSQETQFVNIKTIDSTNATHLYSFNNEAPIDQVTESNITLGTGFSFLEDTNFSVKLEFDRFFSDQTNITYQLIDPDNLNSGFVSISGSNLIGNGNNDRVGNNTIYLRATNGIYQSATIAYNIEIQNVNDAPILNPANANFKIQIPYNQAFSYQLPANFMLDLDTGTTLTYTVSGTLPPGISYNSSTRTFSGTFSGSSLPQVISITGSDGIASVTQTGIGFTSAVTINFNTNGGSLVTSQTIQTSQSVTQPTDPTKTGYTFAGWFSDSGLTQAYNFSGIPNGLNLYAKWNINQYSITFNTDGGSSISSISQNFDTNVVAPANPTKAGYTFIGWSPSLPAKIPANNLAVQALWQINNYSIIFNPNYVDAPLIPTITADYLVDISSALPENPIRTGYTFGGWYEEIGLTNIYNLPNTMPILGSNNATKTLFAKWNINQYTLTFDTAGGNVINSRTQDFNTNIASVVDPIRPGYIFDGWSPAIPAKVPAASVTYTALWISDDYTYRFNSNYQNAPQIPDLTAQYLQDITSLKPVNPVRLGYTFDGWYEDNQLTTPYVLPDTMPILGASGSTKEVFAKWTPVIYRVNYIGMLTSIGSNPITYTIETNTINLQTNFSETGYNFLGFYDNPQFSGQPVTTIPLGSNGDKNLYANWVKASFTLTFKDDKGGSLSSQSVVYGTTIDTSFFPTTSKEGYEFVGWSNNLPSSMPAANVEVIAQFKPLQFKLTIKDSLGNTIADEMLDFESDLGGYSLEEAEIEGFEFVGWAPALPAKMPASNLEIVGTYRELPKFKITVLGTQDEVLFEVELREKQEVPSITLPDLSSASNFVFEGWDGEVPTTMPGANVVIKPLGSKRVNAINLYSADRTFITSIEAQIGTSISLPTPDRLGYMFSSWVDQSGQKISISEMPDQQLNLFASWQAKVYNILVTVGPNDYNINVTFGERIGDIVAPQLFGFRFDGWKNELTGEFVNSNTIFRSPDEIKLVPVFTRLNAGEALIAITRSIAQFILRLFI